MDRGPRAQEDEPILLHEVDLMLAILRSAERGPARLEDAMRHLEGYRALANEPPSPDPDELRARFERAAVELLAARAVMAVDSERFELTARGAQLLARYPEGIDGSVLRQFPEYQAWLEARSRRASQDDPRLLAFAAGMRAFRESRQISDNPYPTDLPDHLAWESGWSVARDG